MGGEFADGQPQFVAQLLEEIARHISDITCDGSTLIQEERHSEKVDSPIGSSEVEKLWAHFKRKRAPFLFDNTKVDFQALSPIHTHYNPMSGQIVNADFSADSKWLLFNDSIDGKFQVCRVQVDL